MKAERNKTIDFPPEDAPEYLARCLHVTEDVPLDAVCGRTICGDTFAVAPHLPRGFADLLSVDPPYNLTKDFSGGGFRRTTDANYAALHAHGSSCCCRCSSRTPRSTSAATGARARSSA